MKPILSCFVAFFICCISFLHSSVELGRGSLPSRSMYWPLKVTVHKAIVGKMHGNTVTGGQEWEFLRYQNGKCLVDMGHNGIFKLNIEDTDLLERMALSAEEKRPPYQGLFTYRYTKSFFDPVSLKGYQLWGPLEQYEYFVLFYFDYKEGSNDVTLIGDFISHHIDNVKASFDLGVLLIPSGNIVANKEIESYITDGLNAPTAVPLMREGLIHTLQHHAKSNGDVVILDKNGFILEQFFLSDLGDGRNHMSLYDSLSGVFERLPPLNNIARFP